MAEAEDPVELTISRLLRTSVLLSASVIALGVLVLAWRGEPYPGARTDLVRSFAFDPSSAAPLGETIDSFVTRFARGEAAAIIQLGVLLLLLTPILRVAATCLLFLRAGDRLLAAIAGVVLCVLALSATGLVVH